MGKESGLFLKFSKGREKGKASPFSKYTPLEDERLKFFTSAVRVLIREEREKEKEKRNLGISHQPSSVFTRLPLIASSQGESRGHSTSDKTFLESPTKITKKNVHNVIAVTDTTQH